MYIKTENLFSHFPLVTCAENLNTMYKVSQHV